MGIPPRMTEDEQFNDYYCQIDEGIIVAKFYGPFGRRSVTRETVYLAVQDVGPVLSKCMRGYGWERADAIIIPSVERVTRAFDELYAAVHDCCDATFSNVDCGKFNAATRFMSVLDESKLQQLFDLRHVFEKARDEALGVGNHRGRPPNDAYHKFVVSLGYICWFAGLPIDFRASGKAYRGDFINLVFECEDILPKELRALQIAKVGARIEAAFAAEKKRAAPR